MIHSLYVSLRKKMKDSKILFYDRFYQRNIYELLTKSEVKISAYLFQVYFLHVYGARPSRGP